MQKKKKKDSSNSTQSSFHAKEILLSLKKIWYIIAAEFLYSAKLLLLLQSKSVLRYRYHGDNGTSTIDFISFVKTAYIS